MAGLIVVLTTGCFHDPCISGFELGVNGSVTRGTSSSRATPSSDPERWNNDDYTVGAHSTVHFDTTGACYGYYEEEE